MVFEFGNLLGVFAFLSLIPFIIVYLIKPRPDTLKVPSLMFFMNYTKNTKTNSLFRYFYRDYLFLIQIIILLLLSFSVLKPVLTLNQDVVSSNIIFVFDVSASSKVLDQDNNSRFEYGVDKLKDLATSKNSLVLLKSKPVLALQDVSRSTLIRYVNNLEPTDDVTDISSAISFAGNLLENNGGRVVVISDLVDSNDADFSISKSLVESRGIPVDFITTNSVNGSNVGIVGAVIDEDKINVYVQNFDFTNREVSLDVNGKLNKISLPKRSLEPFVFSLGDNQTKIRILEKDNFLEDNDVTIIKPYSDNIKVLWVTNNPSKFLKAALDSIDGINLEIARPPVVPEGKYDLYIISDVSKNELVSGTFATILKKIQEEGTSVIILGQKDSASIDYEKLLPMKFNSLVAGGQTNVEYTNTFTKDIDFGNSKTIFDVEGEGTNVVSVNDESVISLFNVGKGKVVYYGLLDEDNDFKLTPGYPIFWSSLLDFLLGKANLNSINLKTGDFFVFDNQTIVLDKKGIYELNGRKFSVNLLNEKESDINFLNRNSNLELVEGDLEKVKSKVDYDLVYYISIIVMLLLIFELVYVKLRGEL